MKPFFLSPYYIPWHRLIGLIRFWRINIRLDMSVERPANEVDVMLSTEHELTLPIVLN